MIWIKESRKRNAYFAVYYFWKIMERQFMPLSNNRPLLQMDTRQMGTRETISHYHSELLKLCDALENIANGLPVLVDTQECLRVAQDLVPIIHEAHSFEEETLFPYLQSWQDKFPDITNSMERLRFEHWEDEAYAEEISEGLKELVARGLDCNFEALSYMLRGFFEGLRRHIAFEVEHLMPILNHSEGQVVH